MLDVNILRIRPIRVVPISSAVLQGDRDKTVNVSTITFSATPGRGELLYLPEQQPTNLRPDAVKYPHCEIFPFVSGHNDDADFDACFRIAMTDRRAADDPAVLPQSFP